MKVVMLVLISFRQRLFGQKCIALYSEEKRRFVINPIKLIFCDLGRSNNMIAASSRRRSNGLFTKRKNTSINPPEIATFQDPDTPLPVKL